MKKTDIQSDRFQILSMWLCFFIYTSTYIGKYSYSSNISLIEAEYAVPHMDAALVLTAFSALYGIGQIINAFFCKRYSKKWIVTSMLLVTATTNLILFFPVPFSIIKYLWVFNGAALSFLWVIIIQVMHDNIGPKHRNRSVFLMGSTTAIGTITIYGISSIISRFGNYRYSFLFAAIITSLAAITWMLLYKPGAFSDSEKEESNEKESSKVLSGRSLVIVMIILGLGSMIAVFNMDGVQSWAPVILKNLHNLPDSSSIFLTIILPVFGVLGTSFAVALKKRIPSFVVVLMIIFTMLTTTNLIMTLFYDQMFVLIIAFGCVSLLCTSAFNTVLTIFPLTVKTKISAGAFSGVLNGACYVGSSLNTLLLGKIADVSGWMSVFITLLITSGICLLVFIIYKIIVRKNPELNI